MKEYNFIIRNSDENGELVEGARYVYHANNFIDALGKARADWKNSNEKGYLQNGRILLDVTFNDYDIEPENLKQANNKSDQMTIDQALKLLEICKDWRQDKIKGFKVANFFIENEKQIPMLISMAMSVIGHKEGIFV